MEHLTKTHRSKVVVDASGEAKVISNALFKRMLETKKDVRSYLKGELSLSELEAKGIELV